MREAAKHDWRQVVEVVAAAPRGIPYDPELNLLYIGTGNARLGTVSSPGGGDNLYLSSIVALNPDAGVGFWHYQTTPGDTWDRTGPTHDLGRHRDQ